MIGALSHIRILDFTQMVQGPLATQMLGDLGADVIKVEMPQSGDWLRHFSQQELYMRGESASFLAFNRNKRSLTLHLKKPEAREIITRLARTSDVVVENFRPGVMDKLGLSYQFFSDVNPRLIYCSASGFGSSGPYVKRPGQDLLIQAMTGIPSLTGREDDPPVPMGVSLADQYGAMHIVYAILAALLWREQSGLGQKVETNLFNSLIALQIQELTVQLNSGCFFHRSAENHGHAAVGAPFGIYQTLDSYIAIAMMPVPRLTSLIDGDPVLLQYDTPEKAFAHRDEIKRLLEKTFVRRRTAEWLEVLDAHDVWCAPVQNHEQLARDPQALHNHIFTTYEHPTAGTVRTVNIPITLEKTPGQIRRPAPRIGEHTDEILQEINFSAGEIALLHRNKVI
jgi:crotonobetainyl-CoA:carnitine CoA-transferase CaiB-like acyl-CoA transferase